MRIRRDQLDLPRRQASAPAGEVAGQPLGYCQRYRSRPKHLAILVYGHALGFNEFGFEILDILVVEGEPALECPIGHASLAPEQLAYLGQDFIKCHAWSSTTR